MMSLVINGQRYELSANCYPGVVHPQGYQYLTQFRLDPFPIFTYVVDGVNIEKSVFMRQGSNTTVVQYQVLGPSEGTISLELRPLIAFRDYHSTTHANGALDPAVHTAPGLVTVSPYRGLPALHLAHNAAAVNVTGDWYRHFEYDRERERGLDFVEDLFNPFVLRFDLKADAAATVIASTERHDISHVAAYRQGEISRRQAIREAVPIDDPFVHTLSGGR